MTLYDGRFRQLPRAAINLVKKGDHSLTTVYFGAFSFCVISAASVTFPATFHITRIEGDPRCSNKSLDLRFPGTWALLLSWLLRSYCDQRAISKYLNI